jgi:hypothetical protein
LRTLKATWVSPRSTIAEHLPQASPAWFLHLHGLREKTIRLPVMSEEHHRSFSAWQDGSEEKSSLSRCLTTSLPWLYPHQRIPPLPLYPPHLSTLESHIPALRALLFSPQLGSLLASPNAHECPSLGIYVKGKGAGQITRLSRADALGAYPASHAGSSDSHCRNSPVTVCS